MSDLLVGTDEMRSQGTHVNAQGFATKDGFSRVSQLWYPKTQSWEEGMERLQSAADERKDVLADVRDITINDDLTVELHGRTLTPTPWGERQLCSWLETPQTLLTFYKSPDAGDKEVIAHAMRNGLRKFDEEKKLLFRTYADGTLRAVMSEQYSIVDNRWYLETLKEFIPGGRLSHFHYSDGDNICGNVLIPDKIKEDDDGFGGMLNIGNSEVGKKTVYQTPSIFRAICMNGCIWGEKSGVQMNKRHRGIVLSELREAIRNNIHKQVPLLTTVAKALVDTRMMKAVASMNNIFAMVAKANSLPVQVAARSQEEWTVHSREASLFGVIDGLTRAGQKFSADIWEECDEVAGKILQSGVNGWNALNVNAKQLDDKTVAKALGMSV